MYRFVEKCWKCKNLTFGDLWWPDLWPDLKIDRSLFVIIFVRHYVIIYVLSVAAYRVSLYGPEAELGGAWKRPPPSPPPARHGKHRPPARRGLTSLDLHLSGLSSTWGYLNATSCYRWKTLGLNPSTVRISGRKHFWPNSLRATWLIFTFKSKQLFLYMPATS